MLTASIALGLALAQVPATEARAAYSIPNTQVLDLPASANGVAYQLYVHVPPECGGERPRCSTVYMLDAEYSFGLASLIVAHLADRDRIPPLISVAIGYHDKSRYRINRTRDYTPYHFPAGGYGAEAQRVSGGGPAFLEILQTQIIPFIERSFPASSDERTLVGHSYGGLFATYAWMESPDLFANYIIVSPSLWYAQGRPLADLERICAERRSGVERDIFLAVGEYEEQPENGRTMVTDLRRMNDQLRSCRARPVSTYMRIFKDESHASIFPAALSTGLRKHFQQ